MTPLEIITKACVAANPSIMELKFGCFINPTSDSIHFALRDCVGGVETIEIINDEDDIIFGKAKLIEPKKILGRPIRLDDCRKIIKEDWWGELIEIWSDGFLSDQPERVIKWLIANLLKK